MHTDEVLGMCADRHGVQQYAENTDGDLCRSECQRRPAGVVGQDRRLRWDRHVLRHDDNIRHRRDSSRRLAARGQHHARLHRLEVSGLDSC